MTARCALAMAAGLLAGAVSAQPTTAEASYDGPWSATISTDRGGRQSTRLVISDFGGYWLAASGREAATGSACAGRRLPITVQNSTVEALEFTVWASQVSSRCSNLTVVARPIDPKRLEGTVASVGTIRLSRR